MAPRSRSGRSRARRRYPTLGAIESERDAEEAWFLACRPGRRSAVNRRAQGARAVAALHPKPTGLLDGDRQDRDWSTVWPTRSASLDPRPARGTATWPPGCDAARRAWAALRRAARLPGRAVRCAQPVEFIGGPKEDRTPDLRIANAALSQLSYRPDSALDYNQSAPHRQIAGGPPRPVVKARASAAARARSPGTRSGSRCARCRSPRTASRPATSCRSARRAARCAARRRSCRPAA
jgi:hypothetical protein